MAKTSYSEQEVLSYTVRNPDAKRRLPAPPFLMLDRITEVSDMGGRYGRGVMVAEKDVLRDEWFFSCHFEGDPVMPGVLQLDAILQLTGFFLVHIGQDGHGRALRTGRVAFREQVRPHNKIVTYRIDIKKVVLKPTPVVLADAVAEVDGVLSAEVEGIAVGLFPDLHYEYPA